MWDNVFNDPQRILFGYDRSKILTYVFGLIFARSIVLSTRSIDIAGEIARGDVSNLLLKPVSYFKYWLSRDIATKVLNLMFSLIEALILFILLKPNFYFQSEPLSLLLSLFSIVVAIFLHFLLVFLFSMPPFWIPHQAWGFIFLLMVFVDILGGGVFPIDILPQFWQKIIYLTPFPYLLFVPINIYLGNFSTAVAFKFIFVSVAWVLILSQVSKKIWTLGLVANKAEGR